MLFGAVNSSIAGMYGVFSSSLGIVSSDDGRNGFLMLGLSLFGVLIGAGGGGGIDGFLGNFLLHS